MADNTVNGSAKARCRRFFVTGRVQGVWFRASTREQARRLGVTGHAHNLPDGGVEVLACGTPDALERLEQWLWQGPEDARVTDVTPEEAQVTPPADFTTG